MNIAVEYTAQLKKALETPRESYDVPHEATITTLLKHIVARHQHLVDGILVDRHGQLAPSMLVFVGTQQIVDTSGHALHPGDTVTFFSPISGG